YPTLAPKILDNKNLPEGELVDYLMASAACFPAMQMRKIGATKYIDGGYYDNMPVNLAIESGAEEIVAVDLEAI
ncbi:MAG: patatin-like phospholipase family protein, partial [Hydrogenoanaerobacterium sp.]